MCRWDVTSLVDRVEGGCAVESGAGVGVLDEEADGRSLAIGEVEVSLLSSAKAGKRCGGCEAKRPLCSRRGHRTLVSSVGRLVCSTLELC